MELKKKFGLDASTHTHREKKPLQFYLSRVLLVTEGPTARISGGQHHDGVVSQGTWLGGIA